MFGRHVSDDVASMTQQVDMSSLFADLEWKFETPSLLGC